MTPKLTIVIPTYNRPHLLPRALESALNQTTPCKIIIADDGDVEPTNKMLADKVWGFETGKRVRHLMTGASYAWENWRAGIQEADTEYVSILQDDDIIRPTFAANVIRDFDKAPDANIWMARLAIAPSSDARLGMWYSGNGPWVPMDLMTGEPSSWEEGSILASSSYFTSWALSPALAYRRGPALTSALKLMPEHCDIFVERLVPALVAMGGKFITNPIIAGYWVQHEGQLSTQQHKEQPAQTKLMVDALDNLMDTLGEWEEALAAWLQLIPAGQVLGWLGQIDVTAKEGKMGRYIPKIKPILVKALDGRISIHNQRTWLGRFVDRFKRTAAL